MIKKISYLVSVSVLASALMGSATQALYEKELIEAIERHYNSPKLQEPPLQTPPAEEDSSWWSTIAHIGSYVKPVAKTTGGLLRGTGDMLRGGNSDVANIVGRTGVQQVQNLSEGTLPGTLVSQIAQDNNALTSVRKTCGNILRYVGASLSGETPKPERTLVNFWIEKDQTDPQYILPSTACALFSAKKEGAANKDTDFIFLTYQKFIDHWNNSSRTAQFKDDSRNLDYFFQGYIRSEVMLGNEVEEKKISDFMITFGIDYDHLSETRGITTTSLYPDATQRQALSGTDLSEQVQVARKTAFKKFIKDTYAFEKIKNDTSLKLGEKNQTS